MPRRPASRPPTVAIAALSVVVLAVAGCSVEPPEPSGPGSSGLSSPPTIAASPSQRASTNPVDLEHLSISLEPFAEVQGGPLAISAPDDGSGRLFVAAQDGRIWAIEADGTVQPDPIIDLGSRLRSGGEQGLLGLALHPDFPDGRHTSPEDRRIFVNYTDEAGDSVIASLELDPENPYRIDPASHRQILFVDQPFANHNGGAVLFGPDGYLYAFFGDGGGGGDPQNNGQSRQTLLGKVLRLDVNESTPDQAYAIPDDNPFADGDGRDEIWLTGLRNPWRASFDRATSDLWIGDVGQGASEEIDVARAGVGGLNFGWNRMEGNHCYPSGGKCQTDGLTAPVTEYGRDLGSTVIGGFVYRGSAYPMLIGIYLFADFGSGRIFAIDPATDAFREPIEVGNGGSGISAFGEDAAGELYVTHLDGEVSRVVATTR